MTPDQKRTTGFAGRFKFAAGLAAIFLVAGSRALEAEQAVKMREITLKLFGKTAHFQLSVGTLGLVVVLSLTVLLAVAVVLALLAWRLARASEAAKRKLQLEVGERQKAEDAVRASKQLLQDVADNSPAAICVRDREGRYLLVNRRYSEVFHGRPEEMAHIKDLRILEEQVLATGETLQEERAAALEDGQHTYVSVMYPLRTAAGEFYAVCGISTDITEHKRLELQLRQSQKMEAVGSLAGGIAHDFNNLLTVILGYSDSILHKIGHTDPIRDKVSEIQAAGQRAASLTRQLLAFSRKQILKPHILDLNTVVSNISQMLRRLLGEDIRISLHLDAGLGQVEADPTQLEQVLVNLAVNARDAMPNGGQLIIETHNRDLDPHTASLQGVPPGQYAVLEVSDTGCGMDEATKARVFEPFFTTKEVGKGTGLGLSMVLGVVQQSGGTVTIYSERGLGTTFKIYLPHINAPVTQSEQPKKTRSAPTQKGAVILLVEDEPSLRALAREVLQEAGYEVLEASDGKEALRVADALTCQPALLLTDVVMPEISGLELAEELGKKWPGLAVVYTSGYTDHALLERNTLREGTPFLQKPYMPASLLEQVAARLDSHALVNS